MTEIQFIHKEKRNEERRIWAAVRAILEIDNYKHKINGLRSKSHWNTFQQMLNVFAKFLKLIRLFNKGYSNVFDIEVNLLTFTSPKISQEFDGYKILHLTDLHLDFVPGLEERIIQLIKENSCDICLITGDLRKDCTGGFRNIINPLHELVSNINAPDGIFATLGNHDTYMMETLEDNIAIKFLINETIRLKRNNESILITGTDDPFRYFTDQQIYALEQTNNEFKIAAIHTSELAQIAAHNEYNLYLCGHTHGGQICLNNGKPLISHQKEGTRFVKGIWNINSMFGYTNKGAGVSGIPVRFNCPGEIAYITLKWGTRASLQKV